MDDYTLIGVRFASFFNGIVTRPDELLPSKGTVLAELFDELPDVNPLPDSDVLIDTPIVQLQSSKPYLAQIARSKADFIYLASGHIKVEDIRSEFLNHVSNFVNHITRVNSISIKGIAVVIDVFVKNERSIESIKTQISNDLSTIGIGEINSIAIQISKRTSINNGAIEVNNSSEVRNTMGHIVETDGVKSYLGHRIMREISTSRSADYSKLINPTIAQELVNFAFDNLNVSDINRTLCPTVD